MSSIFLNNNLGLSQKLDDQGSELMGSKCSADEITKYSQQSSSHMIFSILRLLGTASFYRNENLNEIIIINFSNLPPSFSKYICEFET